MQTLRLFAMVLLAPFALKWWLRRQAAKAPAGRQPPTIAQRPVAEVAIAETD